MPASLRQLGELIDQEVGSSESGFVKAFSDSLFAKASPEFLEELSSQVMLAISLGALKFLKKRPADESLVRVYNPVQEVHGWEGPHTVLEIALNDRPFIVDSVRAGLRREEVELHHFLHPILGLRRDAGGHLAKEIMAPGEGTPSEAYELFLLNRVEDRARLERLESVVRNILADVVVATDDYRSMCRKAREIRDYLNDLSVELHRYATLDGVEDLKEYADFMDWLLADHFVFLGYREYDIRTLQGVRSIQVAPDSALGILRKLETSSYYQAVALEDIPEGLRRRITGGPLLLVTKSNAESTVHRPARMDYVGIKKFDTHGQAGGEQRFLGLLTSKAHSTPAQDTPILRRKLKQVLALDDTKRGSHDFKLLVTIFNSMPREELFWSAPDQIHRDIRTTMRIEQERGVRVTVRPDPLNRGLALMVIMPRDRFNSDVRVRIQRLLFKKLQASHVDYHLAMGEDEVTVRFHFFFVTNLSYDALDLVAINREVAELTRSWDDQLREQLGERGSRSVGLAERYCKAFDDAYKADNPAAEAVLDIDNLEALGQSHHLVDLVNPPDARYPQSASHLKIYGQQPLVLSEVFPILQNLGLRVIEQIPYRVGPEEGRSKSIDVFRVQDAEGCPVDERHGNRLVEAVLGMLDNQVENDRMNHLVLTAGLTVRQVALMRTYRSYLSQVQAAISQKFITQTLLNHPACARHVYDLFEIRFKPLDERTRQDRFENCKKLFFNSLNAVNSLPEDNALRSLSQLVEATVRTNFYRDRPYISLKIRSGAVEDMPQPRPLFEIIVSGLGVVGIHLRGGKVARGGLRWSDRPDDFRTEILSLMKTQMTKNAVIVPVGSKGGFVLKHPPADRSALQVYVEEQYKTFVRGLLDLTDNIVEGEVQHPAELVIYDEADPYLVVAADKGTATFSDIANEISGEYRFWLGDAFASGGSQGYDHKKEGITARGTWECVNRHFRELGIDPSKQDFTVTAIGDMSGDVFGNGMLHTEKIRLQAAFNHRHIFVDPTPDTAKSYQERLRLFQLLRSGWADYRAEQISEGGGVFLRHAKSIRLSPQMKALLGVRADALSGQDLIRAVLKMPVDLLWNGGIGTYVKAVSERHSEVGDPNNDAVRIDATELRARVVGEGGNLGFTQLARVEYALAGGRINTDAIDNSAGVDMSDHEVNLKILMEPMIRTGRLQFDRRNRLLKEMTEEVSRLVLRDNSHQSLCLSLAQRLSRKDLRLFESLQENLAEHGGLKTGVEYLPNRKALKQRRRDHRGFTRPELAILLAYTKLMLQRDLLGTELPDEPPLQHYLTEYFPTAIREDFSAAIADHPLRREIIACQLTGLIVDKLGLAFIDSAIQDTGATREEVIRVTLAALEILELNPFLERILALDDQIAIEKQYAALVEVSEAVKGIVQTILLGGIPIDDLSGFIQRYRDPLLHLRKKLAELLPLGEQMNFQRGRDRALKDGFPKDLAGEIASLEYLPSVMGVIDVGRTARVSLAEAAQCFYDIGTRLGLGWLRDSIKNVHKTTKWEKIAAGGLIQDLRDRQRGLTITYLSAQRAGRITVSEFLSQFARTLERIDQALNEVRSKQSLDLTSGSVVARLVLQLEQAAASGVSPKVSEEVTPH
ncbi:MAG: NAD-glutamate dehydrogenase [Acidobacteriota bacterium]